MAEAVKPAHLLAMLERSIAKLQPTKGEPLVKPCCQSKIPIGEPGSLILHLTARYLARDGNKYVRIQPVLGTDRSSQWASLPSEDWIVLTKAEWSKLLPPDNVRAGSSWELDPMVMAKLLTHFYPPTENTDVRKNRIEEQTVTATVESLKAGVIRARVTGKLKMKHSFYHKDTREFVNASVIGLIDFGPNKSGIRSFQMVTDQAGYGGEISTQQPFGVAVRSLP